MILDCPDLQPEMLSEMGAKMFERLILVAAVTAILGAKSAAAVEGPSFDCARGIRSTLASILCSSKEAAAADWDFNAAYWAAYSTDREQQAFNTSLQQRCALPQAETDQEQAARSIAQRLSRQILGQQLPVPTARAVTPQHVKCIVNALHDQAAKIRSGLSGDAIEESNLSPDEHKMIQMALIQKGLLRNQVQSYGASPDGLFGPNTRIAIKQFQESINAAPTRFLSEEQRRLLVGESRERIVSERVDAGSKRDPAGSGDTPQVSAQPKPIGTHTTYMISVRSKKGGETTLTFGTVASSEEVCDLLRHRLFSGERAQAVAQTIREPSLFDPKNRLLNWMRARLARLGGELLYGFEPTAGSDAAATANILSCSRDLRASDPTQLKSLAIIFGPENCQRSCFSTADSTRIGVTTGTTIREALALREAHPVLRELLDQADERVHQFEAEIRERKEAVETARHDPRQESRNASKGDIRGFSPGMTSDEAERHAREISCAWDQRQERRLTRCSLGDEGYISVIWTNYAQPPLVREVRFAFQSGTPFNELIQQISTQFASQARVENPGAADARASWQIAKHLRLSFYRDPAIHPYVLSLRSQTIEALDERAKVERERAVNPNPKF